MADAVLWRLGLRELLQVELFQLLVREAGSQLPARPPPGLQLLPEPLVGAELLHQPLDSSLYGRQIVIRIHLKSYAKEALGEEQLDSATLDSFKLPPGAAHLRQSTRIFSLTGIGARRVAATDQPQRAVPLRAFPSSLLTAFPYGCPPPGGLIRPGSRDLAREVSLVDLTPGLAAGAVGVWAAPGCRTAAGRGEGDEPPSKVSEMSIAPFTSPKGPAPLRVAPGAAGVGLEFALSCILLTKDGTNV